MVRSSSPHFASFTLNFRLKREDCERVQGQLPCTHVAHTHTYRELGRASPSTPHTINFWVCAAPRGALVACLRACRELLACV